MLPSLKFFRNDPCPYFRAGLCDRPHCPFRHCASARPNIFEEEDEEVVPLTSKKRVPIPKGEEAKGDFSHSGKERTRETKSKKSVPNCKIEESGKAMVNTTEPDTASEAAAKEAEEKAERKRLEEEYERMLLGGDDDYDDEDIDIDSDIAEQFLLPEDTDSEDPAELMDACYKEWLRSKKEPKPKSPTKQKSVEESAQSSKSIKKHDKISVESVSPKKRVAHQKADDSVSMNSSRASTSTRIVKLTPAQTLQNRYEQLKRSSSVSEASSTTEDGNKLLTAEPHVGLITLSYKSSPVSSVNNSLKMKAGSNHHHENATISQTLARGTVRKAHSPIRAPGGTSRKPTIGKESIAASKIPLITRQHTLDQLFKACANIYSNHEEAAQRSSAEELVLATRHKNKQVYVGASANCLKRLRDEAAQVQKQKGTKNKKYGASAPSSAPTRTVTVVPLLPPSRRVEGVADTGTWSIEAKRRREPLVRTTLYQALKHYLLTPEQLTDNGYPRTHPSGDRGRITTKNRKNKPPYNGNSSSRVCDRCGKNFMVALDGTPVIRELCIYHHGRNYKRRVRGGGYEGRYNCCDAESNSQGCVVANLHVSNHPSDEIYGFVAAVRDPGFDFTMGNDPWDIVALDCEMVYTTYGSELARATFVSADKRILFDELVRPIHPIIDYNTRFSGITEEMMEGVKTSLTDVQAALLSHLRPNTILIGHSLESDLMALKLKHDTVVDTAVLIPHRLGPPFKRALRTLASDCLGKIIQTGECGHDSEEDAITALELVLWKIQGDRLIDESRKSKRGRF